MHACMHAINIIVTGMLYTVKVTMLYTGLYTRYNIGCTGMLHTVKVTTLETGLYSKYNTGMLHTVLCDKVVNRPAC